MNASTSRQPSDAAVPRLPLRAAAAVGLIAVAAALAAGHLVAALIDPFASPFLAVGNTAIDLTPHPVKDFAIRTFGENDKIVLLAGMAFVITAAAALAGLLSRRSALPGTVLAATLGVLGVAAVLTRPTLDTIAVLAPLTSLVVGVLVFRWLHRLARRTRVGEPGADESQPVESAGEPRTRAVDWSVPGLGRRRFLITSTAVAAAAGATAAAGQFVGGRVDVEASRRSIRLTPDVTAPPIPAGADFTGDGTPTFITSNADFYRVDTALSVPRLRAQDWRMRVHGLVDRELVLTYDDLLNRPLVEKTISLCCVSNEVGGPYISTTNFIGVSLRDLLTEAGVRPGADQLATRSADGWTCGTPVEDIMKPDSDALLAIGMNGEPLPAEHGFPVRMVVPGLYGFVSATKWLVDAELTTFADFDAYWVKRDWAQRAPIKTMSRIDRPKPFEQVPAGKFVAAGVAWAQHKGIDKVEVRVDGGPWQAATLSTEVNVDTWRMWRAELDLPAGSRTLEVRATDRTGYTQTSERAEPIPDGAAGRHTIVFTARP
ncbi:DMSO/TMAO reductase YedYZ molybdopterin-dependent catalytic subunit [Saccharothrix carnea]|uniref:DMSO/TMAO reductase YedYZ molybdopterin-dependent catalytic subunit n=1 Tax=Saccharothrix carnea TaxID=1280637 RepID=A0A2P8I0Q1_SACCR|nr:molybdopterin-dependent oxidoreductase [Saccharothrix carnea]PSL52049.1 DMSO/TMAO reductase YedYZ molybdopterin-dependent catalytic subunit [Saccharothrix carnea]